MGKHGVEKQKIINSKDNVRKSRRGKYSTTQQQVSNGVQ
jgi:hypothetical protein